MIEPSTQTWRSRLVGKLDEIKIDKLDAIRKDRRFEGVVYLLIVVNAITLGLETFPPVMASAGTVLVTANNVMLSLFVVELAIRLGAEGWRFFRNPWNVFDFTVVGLALVPATEHLAVMRTLRVLRILRVMTALPRMRSVVAGLLGAMPSVGAVVMIVILVFYAAAVMATQLFGEEFPEWFGSLWASLYSLFQIMTLESWSQGIVRPVMEFQPYSWVFFVPFILIASFTMMNLFIAVVVTTMQRFQHEAEDIEETKDPPATRSEFTRLFAEVQALSVRLDTARDNAPLHSEVLHRLETEVRALRAEVRSLKSDLKCD